MTPLNQDLYAKLTPRQREVAHLIARGLTNDEIGKVLFIDEKSVKFHVTRLLAKCNVTSRAKLIVRHWSYLLGKARLKEYTARLVGVPDIDVINKIGLDSEIEG